MPSLITEYPYLVGNLTAMVIYGIALAVYPAQRRPMLLSSVLAVPLGLFAILFVPEYWNPKRVAVFLIAPEDFIFMFVVGGAAWLGTVWFVRRRIRLQFNASVFLRRCVASYGFGIVVGGSLYLTGMGPVRAGLFTMAAWSLLLL